MKRVGFKVDRKLNFGEKSSSELYVLVSNKGDFVLRISLTQGIF